MRLHGAAPEQRGDSVRIALLDDYQGVAVGAVPWSDLPDAEVVAFGDHVDDADALVERLRSFDVVVAMRERTPFPQEVLARLPALRLLVATGWNHASIDFAAARALGIVVCGTQGSGPGTEELTWGLILALVRNIPAEDAAMRRGGWQHTMGTTLAGSTLGVLGLGRLGSRVASIGRAFGMRTIAWSPRLTPERAAEHDVEAVDRDALFATSDVLSIHIVLGETTRGLVGERELRLMRPTAYLVNTSRGPIVDEAALLRALHEGWIAGAALDVFDREPLPTDHPLRSAPRTVLTPHVGYVTREIYAHFYAQALENVRAFLDGHPIRVLDT